MRVRITVRTAHYVKKANEPIEQGERCAYEDIPLRQYSFHIIGHMKFSLHCEMRRGVALSEQKSRKRMYLDGVILQTFPPEDLQCC